MKQTITTVILILFSLSSFAQTKLNKTIYAGTGITLTNFQSITNKNLDLTFLNLKLNALKIGYFVSEKSSIGINYDYLSQNLHSTFSNSVNKTQLNSINANFRYFFNEKAIRPYAHFEIGHSFEKKTFRNEDVIKLNDPALQGEYSAKLNFSSAKIGMGALFVFNSVQLESDILFNKNFGSLPTIFDNELRLRLGINYIFNKKK